MTIDDKTTTILHIIQVVATVILVMGLGILFMLSILLYIQNPEWGIQNWDLPLIATILPYIQNLELYIQNWNLPLIVPIITIVAAIIRFKIQKKDLLEQKIKIDELTKQIKYLSEQIKNLSKQVTLISTQLKSKNDENQEK